MTQTHKHKYATVTVIRDSGTTPGGNHVDRLILARKCDCGASKAFECGPKEPMMQLYKQLEGPK